MDKEFPLSMLQRARLLAVRHVRARRKETELDMPRKEKIGKGPNKASCDSRDGSPGLLQTHDPSINRNLPNSCTWNDRVSVGPLS